jgi:hypothetical protein
MLNQPLSNWYWFRRLNQQDSAILLDLIVVNSMVWLISAYKELGSSQTLPKLEYKINKWLITQYNDCSPSSKFVSKNSNIRYEIFHEDLQKSTNSQLCTNTCWTLLKNVRPNEKTTFCSQVSLLGGQSQQDGLARRASESSCKGMCHYCIQPRKMFFF